jgi:hypothetical protein
MISHQLSVIIKILDIPKDSEQEFVDHFFFHSPCAAGYLLFLYSPAGERLCGLCPFPFIFVLFSHGMPAFSYSILSFVF